MSDLDKTTRSIAANINEMFADGHVISGFDTTNAEASAIVKSRLAELLQLCRDSKLPMTRAHMAAALDISEERFIELMGAGGDLSVVLSSFDRLTKVSIVDAAFGGRSPAAAMFILEVDYGMKKGGSGAGITGFEELAEMMRKEV
jgi:hypothetical protein